MANTYISDFVRPNGRLDYLRLCKYARQVSSGEFGLIFKRPLLVGSAIYSGELEKSKTAGHTMVFKVLDAGDIKDDSDEDSSLKTAIFPLYKRKRGDAKPNIISIGRSNDNDLVVNDYPVSREHGHIRIQLARFFLTDFGTTNGTILNEKRLEPNVEVELKVGDTIGLGRYNFRFMLASALHRQILEN